MAGKFNTSFDLQSRIKNFRDIIAANNTALDSIAQLQQQLQENTYVNSQITTKQITNILVNTFKMIKYINELCDNKYSNLYKVYDGISSHIKNKLGESISNKHNELTNKFIVPFSEIDRSCSDIVGGKIAFLCDIKNKTTFFVPDGFAITESAYALLFKENSLDEQISSLLAGIDFRDTECVFRASSRLQKMIINARLPDRLEEDIQNALKVLKAHTTSELRVSVRSSALFESNAYTSFAGQYRSLLNMPEDEVLNAYLEVVASKFAPEAMVYAETHGYNIEDIRMCVAVQHMIDAKSSGVMFTSWQNINQIMIQAIYGLGLYIVNGSLIPDTYIYNTKTHRIADTSIGEKHLMLICDIYGTKEQKVDDRYTKNPSIDNDQIAKLADIGEKLTSAYKTPLDIEWAIDAKSNIFILQCRPRLYETSNDTIIDGRSGIDIEWAIDDHGEPYILEYRETGKAQSRLKRNNPSLRISNQVVVDGGVTASPGTVSAAAFNVNSNLDIMKFPPGSIIITKTADPKLAVLLKKAVGIISQMGDITVHLAAVARESNIPALFATGNTPINEGEIITLDANNRKVYLGIVQELIGKGGDKTALSPPALLLKEILKGIAVLNIPNPVNSNTQALKCKTIHDIIRFVHQTAIEEMFKTCDSKVSKEPHAKKIASPIPINLIAFDLGGGIAADTHEDTVSIENITSIPMQALWEGMMHKGIKWSGERNINMSGLISAMTSYMVDEGTSMRGLGSPSYVFISENYMNFNSRVGYHFATVDAYIGEYHESNYINFRFSGGANTLDRRSRRTALIDKILADANYKSIRTMDVINSSIQNLPQKQIKEKLGLLGRLLGFVNRLDIAMVTDNDIDKYYNAFKEQRYDII